jgi:pilus assembly protein Flp/PilA
MHEPRPTHGKTGVVGAQILVAATPAATSITSLLKEEHMKRLIVRFVREDEGQDLIEYALLATFVSVAAAVGATAAGTQLNGWYNALASTVSGMAASL